MALNFKLCEYVVEAIMNAVMIYNDSACAAKAKVMLERAAHRADAALPWTVKPWRLDMLMPSLSADAALADAAEAHLILLVLRHPLLFPPWLRDWLAQWAARRQVQDAALALWDGGDGDTLPAAAAPDLSRFAERHGLSFIFGGGGPAEDQSAAGFSHRRAPVIANRLRVPRRRPIPLDCQKACLPVHLAAC